MFLSAFIKLQHAISIAGPLKFHLFPSKGDSAIFIVLEMSWNIFSSLSIARLFLLDIKFSNNNLLSKSCNFTLYFHIFRNLVINLKNFQGY